MEWPNEAVADEDWLINVWRSLDERSCDMLVMRAHNRTLDSIGRAHGVTRERARQIIKNAQGRLSTKTRCTDPEWATCVLELLKKQVAISDYELSCILPDESGVIRASLLIAEGLSHPRPWSGEISDHWALSPEALDDALLELAISAPYRTEELGDFAQNLGVPMSIDIKLIMSSPRSPLVFDESGVWVRRSARKRDAAYLWLADRGEPVAPDVIADAIKSTVHAVTEALRRDDRFRQVRPEGTWALADWPLEGVSDHTNALDVVIEVLTELGPIPQRELTHEVRRRYPVTASRIHQCLVSQRIGRTQDGRIGLIEHGALTTEVDEPRRPDSAVHDENLGLLAFRIKVDKDVIRGSGVIISPWITWRLGLRQAPMARTFVLEGSGRSITFRRGTSAAQMSSLRLEVSERGMALGCEFAAVLRLELGTITIRHVCDPSTCPA